MSLARTFRVSFTAFSFFVLAPNVAYHLPQLPTLSQCPTLEACHMVLHPVWQMRAIFTLAASDNSCPTSKTLMFLVCYKLTKDWDGAWVLCQWDTGHVVLQILKKKNSVREMATAGVYRDRIYETVVVYIMLFVLFSLLFTFSYFLGFQLFFFLVYPNTIYNLHHWL